MFNYIKGRIILTIKRILLLLGLDLQILAPHLNLEQRVKHGLNSNSDCWQLQKAVAVSSSLVSAIKRNSSSIR